MTTTDIGNLEPDRLSGLVRGTGVARVVWEVVGQRARTSRAKVRGRTMVELAGVLGGTGAGAEVTVAENDGSQWSMTVRPAAVGEEAAR